MAVVGIIAEYNPLHAGHDYHMKTARTLLSANACVVVLSSNFVQRGEPALISKWARTKMALYSGADLVLELPCAFSSASAEYFASGAVRILDSLNFVDYLCFGSEEGNLEPLETAAHLLAFESQEFRTALKKGLDEGLSFPAAREKALNASPAIKKPNNILGIEYIKAIKRLGSTIKPVTIERVGQGYHSLDKESSFSSATAIRRHLCDMGNTCSVDNDPFMINNLPESSLKILSEEISQGRGPVFPEAFESIVLHLVRSTPENELSCLPYMGEGLENRLKKAALKSGTFKELVSSITTSRYPASRIKRILLSLVTSMTGEFLENLKINGYAQYIRVLGFNETGRALLSQMRKKAKLPIIIKPASFTKLENPLAKSLFEHEIRSTDAFVLGYPCPDERKGGSELLTSPIYLKA